MFEELAYVERGTAVRQRARLGVGSLVGRWISDAWYLFNCVTRRNSPDAY